MLCLAAVDEEEALLLVEDDRFEEEELSVVPCPFSAIRRGDSPFSRPLIPICFSTIR